MKLGGHQRHQPDPFTREERDAIMAWMLGKPQGLYFRTAFATGMRSGELIALEWSQYQGDSLRVHQSRVRGRRKDTKTHRERRVYLPTWLTAELDAHGTRPAQGAIFLNQYGRAYQKPDKLNRVFRRCLTELAIRPRRGPYPWRHTYASIGISEGAEPAFLARQLGHALETFYGTYAQWLSQDQDLAQREIIEGTW
jgi:integrase